MARPAATPAEQDAHSRQTRELVWSWLILRPGATSYEIAQQCLRDRRGSGGTVRAGSTFNLLTRMERAGQVTRETEYRAQQGRIVTLWYAAPGAFRIETGEDRA